MPFAPLRSVIVLGAGLLELVDLSLENVEFLLRQNLSNFLFKDIGEMIPSS